MKKIFRYIFILFFFIFLYVIFRRFGEISEIVRVLRSGIWYFLFIALIFESQVIINQVFVYESLHNYLGAKDKFTRLLRVYLGAFFVNNLAPSGGLSGIALFINEAENSGLSKSQAIIVYLLSYLINYSALLLVIIFALSNLFSRHQLETYQVLTAGILAGLVVISFVLLKIFLGSVVRFRRVLIFVSIIVNRIAQFWQDKKIIEPIHIRNFSDELVGLAQTYRSYPKGIWVPFLFSLLVRIAEVATLYFVFRAFGVTVPLITLVTGYSIGMLFSIVSITPSGLGVVEATMVIVFVSLGISVESATVVTIAWRLYTFWLPLIAGFAAFRKINPSED